jgi:hypothetical protein
MTCVRSYKCNFCGFPIDDKRPGHGYEWRSNHLAWIPIARSDNHLCHDCVEVLKKSLPELDK